MSWRARFPQYHRLMKSLGERHSVLPEGPEQSRVLLLMAKLVGHIYKMARRPRIHAERLGLRVLPGGKEATR